jgi:hypothetical protein
MPINSTANPDVIHDRLTLAVGLHLRAMTLWKNACVVSPSIDI